MPEAVSVRAVVADDEPAARDVVVTLLRHEPVEVVGEATNGEETVALVRQIRPELLFLDIQMPDLDGFGVLEALGDDVPPGIVFVTAHDEHALRAFDVHALDYVLKPFGRPRFHAAVARALRRLEAEDALGWKRTLDALVRGRDTGSTADVAGLLRADVEGDATTSQRPPRAAPRPSPASPPRLGVRFGARTVLVDVPDIDWIEADGDYARLHVGGRIHLVSERMHALERTLDPAHFLRIHRSAIVNLDRVRELRREPDGGGVVVLRNEVRLRVARSRWEKLEGALGLAG
ncbi:MAG TPA: LytTR family DNA-binding domain-containing protein [Longimicrobiales bacterium]|nr:LytTR family DNA-binding domain-containing protein [Longimicrobiales bacterium]